MKPNMSRFREPDASDERADCQGSCGRTLHYTALDENGLCRMCRPDEHCRSEQQEKDTNEQANT